MGKGKTEPAGSSHCRGFFRAHEQLISGWALDHVNRDKKLQVEIFVDGRSVGFTCADRYDPSVQSQYGGDGKHAFAFLYSTPEIGWIEGQALAKERFEGVELRTKSSRLVRSEAATPQLVVENVTLARIVGQARGYPPVETATLEFWSGDRRIVSDIPLRWDDKKQRRFTARLTPEAIACLLSGPIEVALPGLKEAGLSVPFTFDGTACVSQGAEGFSVELSGEYDDRDTIEIAVEFLSDGYSSKRIDLIASKGKASFDWPEDVPLGGASVRVLICGAPVVTKFAREFQLGDPTFANLSDPDRGVWELSEGCFGERGFYAFPTDLRSEFGLSGDFAHLWSSAPESGIRISQRVHGQIAIYDSLRKRAILRARKGARLALRFVDDVGILGEATCASRGEQRWVPLCLDIQSSRAAEGQIRFEIEAQGDAIDELEIALGDTTAECRKIEKAEAANLLVNDKLSQWPYGAAVLLHTIRGEICQGWRVYNRRCQAPVLSRAVMDPHDGSIGLAIAAPEVSHYLRLEADLSSAEAVLQSTVLRFRAGMSGAARQLLSQSTEATPEFTLIDRVFILRRTRAQTSDGFADKDEIVSTVARKVPIGWDMEKQAYLIQPCQLPELEDDIHSSQTGAPERTYHLVFEFRRAAVLAIHDIELLRAPDVSNVADEQPLLLEDRNIQIQVPLLKTIAHWSSPTPMVPFDRMVESRPSLKWSIENSREPVEIVVPVHNALEETMGCLNSLSRCTAVPILVRLIDDGSDAPVLAALEAYASDKPWIQVSSLGRNRGYTFAADFGIRSAHSSWVVLLNSDTVVTQGWLKGMLACARSDKEIAFVGPLSNAATYQSVPQVYDAAGKFKTNGLPLGMTPDDVADLVRQVSRRDYPEVPLLNGFCTLMKKSAYLESGGLNCGAFPAGYGEENDLCIRVRKAGAKLAIADDVYVYHHKSASFGHARRADLSKKGGAALRKLHPDVDISSLTTWFKEVPSLAAVRAGVSRELARVFGDIAA